MKSFFTIIILLSTVFAANAQTPNELHFYPNTSFKKVVERNNTLWIISEFSVIKFDKTSKSYEHFDIDYSQLPNRNTQTAAVDTNNNLWIVDRENGLYKFDGQNWTHQDSMSEILDTIIYVYDMHITQNNEILVGTNDGLFQYHNTHWTVTHIEYPITWSSRMEIEEDNQGNIWVANNHLHKYDGTNWIEYDYQNTLLPFDSGMNKITIGTQNDVWFKASSRMLGSYINNTFDTIHYPNLHPGLSPWILDIAVRANGEVWTSHKPPFSPVYNIHIWDGTTFKVWDYLNTPMVNQVINLIHRGSNGSMWIIGNQGIDEVRPNGDWYFYDTKQSTLEGVVQGVVSKSSGDNFVITGYGIHQYDWTEWKHSASYDWEDPDALIRKNYQDEVYVLANNNLYTELNDSFVKTELEWISPYHKLLDFEVDNNGKIWAVHRYDNGWNTFNDVYYKEQNLNNWTILDPNILGLSMAGFYDIAIDSNNVIWFLSAKGLIKYDNQMVTIFDTSNSNIPNMRYLAIDNNNDLWLSSYPNGSYLFDGQNFNFKTTYGGRYLAFNSNNEVMFTRNINQKWVDTTLVPTGLEGYSNVVHFDQNDNFFFTKSNISAWSNAGLWIYNENGIQPVNIAPNPSLPKVQKDEIPILVYPNPVTDFATIAFELTVKEKVRIDIYNQEGKFIKNAYSENLDAEKYQRPIDFSELPNGIYFIRIKAETQQGITQVIKIQ